MSKYLLIGDVHATQDSLAEVEKLFDFVLQTANEQKPDEIVFLGDLYHNHNVIYLEVQRFLDSQFKKLENGFKRLIVIVGNHDKPVVSSSKDNALMAHQNIELVSHFLLLENSLFIGFCRNNEEFTEICRNNPSKIVFCHQEFDGARYDNGLFIPDGIDQNSIPQEYIISGHIHTPQTYGKVNYIGSPRWISKRDANIDRFIVLFDTETIEIVSKFDTSVCCRKIFVLEEESYTGDIQNATVYLNLRGTKKEIAEKLKKYKGLNVRIKTIETEDLSKIEVKESEGIEKAFWKFLDSYTPKRGTDLSVLKKMALERLKWQTK